MTKSKTSADRLILFAVLCITFFAFIPSLYNGFTNWDDQTHLLENPHVQVTDIDSFLGIFTSTTNQTYIPLTILSFAIEYYYFGFDPFIYHLNNLLLHIGVVALIFQFILRLNHSCYTAGLAALIFAIHPMHVESVAWVTERKDVLYSLFFMLALINYLKYVDKKNKKFYLLSILFGLLSMLTKGMALTLPVVLIICDWYKKRDRSFSLLLEKIPYLLYILPLAWITYSGNMIIYSLNPNLIKSVLVGIWTFTFYISKFLWPFPLSPVYLLHEPVSVFELTYLGAVVVCSIFCFLCISLRKNRIFIFAVAFYMASLPFLLRFDSVKFSNGIIAADRFMYLSSVGICLLLGFWVEKIFYVCRKRGILIQTSWIIIVSFLFGGIAILTYNRCKIWKDSHSLMTEALRFAPTAAFAYNNRAFAYMAAGQYDLALADYNQAIKYSPWKSNYYSNRGSLYSIIRKYELAIKNFNQVIILKPDNFAAYYNRGTLYCQMGQYHLAITDFNTALRIKPDHKASIRNRLLAIKEISY